MEEHAHRIPYWEFELACTIQHGWTWWMSVITGWPFGRLFANPRSLTFRVIGGWTPRYVLPRENVIRVEVVRRLFRRGIRFEHDQRKLPNYLVVWTFKRERLLSELRAMGYPVT
jgi:hypothetical protein